MSIDYSQPVKPALGDRLAYFAFLCLELILRLFPLAFWCFLGRSFGLLAWAILPKYRRLVRRNMRIIFAGKKDTEEMRQLVKENFQTVICNFLASAKAATMSDKALSRHFTVVGKEEVLSSLQNEGKGVICAIAHMGNWELLARVRVRFKEVSRFGSMYRELDNPLMEKLWLNRRQKSGCEMFGKKTASFADSSKILRDNGMLGILCDQNSGNYGVLVPYYGKMTSTTNLPALIQRRTRAAIHPVTVRTTGLGKWEVRFGPKIELKDEGKDLTDTTARINATLADIGRKSPADGFWLHNRWKQDTLVPRGEPVANLQTDYGRAMLPLRLLVSMPDAFDESLLFIPVMKAIAAARRDAEWNVLCPTEQKEFWESIPEIAHVAVCEGDMNEVLASLNNASPVAIDVAYLIDGGNMKVYRALSRLSGVVLRALEGEHPKLKGWKHTMPLPVAPAHRAEEYGQFVHCAQITPTIKAYFPQKREMDPLANPPILIAPFSTLGKKMEWPEGFWAKVYKLRPRPQILIALEKDRKRAEQWALDLGIEARILPGAEILEEMKKAKLLVAVDGLLPRLATYAGTPTVTLFSERDPHKFAPLGDFHEYVQAEATEYWDDEFVESLIRKISDAANAH